MKTRRGSALVGLTTIVLIGLLAAPATADGATRWKGGCAGGNQAAEEAGFKAMMDANLRIRAVFADPDATPPSDGMRLVQSWCGDINGDGRRDRAVLFRLKGGSGGSPAAAAVLIGRSTGPRVGWQKTGFVLSKFRGVRKLRIDRNIYSSGDATCCPSRTRAYSLTWRRGKVREGALTTNHCADRGGFPGGEVDIEGVRVSCAAAYGLIDDARFRESRTRRCPEFTRCGVNRTVRVNGYSCRFGRFARSSGGEGGTQFVRCRNGTRRVSWRNLVD